MRKLGSYKELVVGGIYNRVYTGNNAAYAKINGKETFLVLETKPKLLTVVLFDQFGDPLTDDIRSSKDTFDNPEIAFREFELFEPAGENEWLKKAVKLTSLQSGLDRDLITIGDIKHMAGRTGHSPFIPSFDLKSKLTSVRCNFQVEDKTAYPLLQTVFVVWPNWEELIAEFQKLGIKVRT